jgi:hypothetical protein
MTKADRFIYLWLILLVFNLPSFAQDQSIVIKNLSWRADVILTGTVTQMESNWNESKTRIYTKTTVQVEEFIKGNNNENFIEISHPGGEVGDMGELYTHMPKFENNEEVLVFLKKDEKKNQYKIVSGAEGKIRVLEDAKTKEKVTSSNLPIKDLKMQIESYLSEQ